MAVSTTKFGRGINPRNLRKRNRVQLIVEPDRGLHSGLHPEEMEPGFSPSMANFCSCTRRGGIEPRPGLSAQSSSPGFNVLGGQEIFAADGSAFAVASGDTEVALLELDRGTWSQLSYLSDGGFAPSGTSRDYWDMDETYDPSINRNLAILTNNNQSPKYFEIRPNQPTFSDFTFSSDLVEKAKSVIEFDNRLVFFGVNDRPNRVAWSVRGKPTNWNIEDGAGFEDLAAMAGESLFMQLDNDGFLLFSTEEIWRARPRRTAEAFSFDAVSHEISSPFPRTAVRTPFGVVFLGRDLEVYTIRGNSIQALGLDERGESRIQAQLQDEAADDELERAWGVYNEPAKRYELYYSVSGEGNGYPTRALYFDFNKNAWYRQQFDFGLSLGFETSKIAVRDLSGTEWDSVATQWDNMLSTDLWDTFGVIEGADVNDRGILAFSESNGTAYKFDPSATSDDGSTITARWRSHAIRHPEAEPMRRVWMHELWAEYDSDGASNVSVFFSRDQGQSFFEASQRSIQSSNFSRMHIPTRVGTETPQFEIQLNDGGRPRFHAFQANVAVDSRHAGAG